jgi:hypothetical protein
MLNYLFIILWVLEQAEMATNAFAIGFATTDVGMGVAVVGALGTNIFGLTGLIAIVGLTTTIVGATIIGYYFFTISPLCLGR